MVSSEVIISATERDLQTFENRSGNVDNIFVERPDMHRTDTIGEFSPENQC